MDIRNHITNAARYDVAMHATSNTDNGWKISIQGKSVEDSFFLYERLSRYLVENDVPFKVATDKRYADSDKEQSRKAMTIYCPNEIGFMGLCEDVYSRIMDYKGWHDIKTPTSYQHYAGGLFFRNDRGENGEYIPAQAQSSPNRE
jgi:hypothetical protein